MIAIGILVAFFGYDVLWVGLTNYARFNQAKTAKIRYVGVGVIESMRKPASAQAIGPPSSTASFPSAPRPENNLPVMTGGPI